VGHRARGAHGHGDRLLPTSRLETFSDGVFAIAITLLVLELHVPTGHAALVRGLGHERPRYLGYLVSFSFIGGVWIAHSNMTRFIKVSLVFIIEPLQRIRIRARAPSRRDEVAEPSEPASQP
jgi:hypothetical protein